MNPKTFRKALTEINANPSLVRAYLMDKRLTQAEKTILETYLLVRNNKNSEAETLLSKITPSPIPFVEAFKFLLKGIAQNNQSHFKQSEASIKTALDTFIQLEDHYFQFLSYFNLTFVYVNQSDQKSLDETIQKMEAVCDETDLQRFRLMRCKFNHYLISGNVAEAKSILTQMQDFKVILESDAISHLLNVFMFYISQEDLKSAYSTLEEMKSYRKFHLSENFNYMKKMLDHLSSNEPIYLSTLKTHSVPVLHHQLSVIHYLEEKNYTEARKHWDALVTLSPQLYSDPFKYNGEKCLFSLCLSKHLHQETKLESIEKNENASHLDLLIDLLLRSQGPVSKGLAYEYIWGTPPVEKDDLKRLGRLISRIRTEKGIDIISRKGTYFIEKKPLLKKLG